MVNIIGSDILAGAININIGGLISPLVRLKSIDLIAVGR